MERFNSEGIPRDSLLTALRNPLTVRAARRADACLLCRRPNVNEAGICQICYSMLDGAEIVAVTRLLNGQVP